MSPSVLPLVKEIVSTADQKKGFNARVYQPYDKSVSDYFVVISAQNPIHAKSLLRDIDAAIITYTKANSDDAFFIHPKHSGEPESGWVILDDNSIMVHIVSEAIRDTYQLDHLFEQRAVIVHL